jgi:hypothetical protein
MVTKKMPNPLLQPIDTAEHGDMWDQIANRDGIVPGTPKEKIRAMNRFLREYEIAPVYRIAAQIKRSNSATVYRRA